MERCISFKIFCPEIEMCISFKIPRGLPLDQRSGGYMVVLIEVDAGIAPKSLLEQSLVILLFLPQSVLSLLCVVCLVVDEPSPM